MKLRIKDDFGEKFEVEEITDDFAEEETMETIDDDDIVEEDFVQDEESLSSDEISALKRLAGVVDKLLALIPADDEVQDADEEEIDMDETIADEDEIEETDETITDDGEEIAEEEEVIDTNPIGDSFGSVAKKVRKRDSVDKETEISNAWNNQYAKFDKNR